MITLIVACAPDKEGRLAIGRNGAIPWNIPQEIRKFQKTTTGHPIVMGRKTYDSLPRKPLPKRENIVLTTQSSFPAPSCRVITTIDPIVSRYQHSDDQCFVIGGESVYRAFWPVAQAVHISRIDMVVQDADAFFPFLWSDIEIDFELLSFNQEEGDPSWKEHVYIRRRSDE